MIGQDDYIEYLRDLSPPDLEREVHQEVADALQELVACIERALPLGGNTLHSCVVDDFQLHQPVVGDRECRARLRFDASARQGVGGAARLERLAGHAEAAIDRRGRVSFRGVTFTEEPAFVAHDIGGGD
jgi:hypothetical protein